MMLELLVRLVLRRALEMFCAAAALATMMPHEALAQSCIAPPPNLVAWWPGDGNTNDIIGTPPKNGTFVGTVSYGAGKVGQAFSFTGSGRVSIASAPTSTAFTIDAWVYVNSAADLTGYKTIYADDYRGFWLLGGKIVWWGPGNLKFAANTPVTPGIWQHVALTYNGATFAAYLNGAPDGSVGSGGQYLPALAGIGIGGHSVVSEHFKGLIDEVEIFGRALSPAEIKDIYDAQSAGKCKPGSSAGYDIQLTKTSIARSYGTEYTITLLNMGDPIVCPATITVPDNLPAGLTIIGGQGPGASLWSMAPGTGTVGPATITLTATCPAGTTIPTGGTFGLFNLYTSPTPIAPNCATATTFTINGVPVTETSTSNNSACK